MRIARAVLGEKHAELGRNLRAMKLTDAVFVFPATLGREGGGVGNSAQGREIEGASENNEEIRRLVK